MKTAKRTQILTIAVSALIAVVSYGQTLPLTVLHDFTNCPDGAFPQGLVMLDNTLYGTTQSGGSPDPYFHGNGTVFSVRPDGTGYTILHTFTAIPGSGSNQGFGTNTDGATPAAVGPPAPPLGLLLSGNTFYGITTRGGANGHGTIFSISTNGIFTVLYNFTNSGYGGTLALSGSTFYGVQTSGGSGFGSVFSVQTNGSNFTVLHSFTRLPPGSNTTNADGAAPIAGLTLSGGTLYGTTSGGGSGGSGVVFSVNTNGTGFTVLHSFTTNSQSSPYTNADGAGPEAALVLSGDTLYGTTSGGGANGSGTIFAVKTNGTDFTVLYHFPEDEISTTPLTLSSNLLWGGNAGSMVFYLNANGTDFTEFYNRSTNVCGSFVLSSNMLYGATGEYSYGTSNVGMVFSLQLPPPSITQQPLGLACCPGSSPVFGVTVTGIPSFGYQWRKDGTNLVDGGNVIGSTTTNLTLLDVSQSDSANYDVVITDFAGCVTSSVATLFVTSTPAQAAPIVVNGFIVGAILTDGGCGYTNQAAVYFGGQGGNGAAGYVQISSDGTATNIVITSAGFGYPSNTVVQIPQFLPTVSITLTNTPAAAAIPVIINGFIVGANLTASGSGYTIAPPVTFSDVSGSGATAYAQIDNGSVTNIFVTSAGSGYSSNTVIIIPPAGYLNAVVPGADSLLLGQPYQLQTASDLNNWKDFGASFIATNNAWTPTDYWNVANTNGTFFRLRMLP